VDVCVDGVCGWGLKAECAVCRTAGFWGERGGTKYDQSGQLAGFNYTQAVIDAAIADRGCLSVCGHAICGTEAIAGPGALGSLGSAVEALCVEGNDPGQLNQSYRQMVTAALNCVLSGAYANSAGCEGLFEQVLVGIDWQTCNQNCAGRCVIDVDGGHCANGDVCASDADCPPDDSIVMACLNQLDCWNNGHGIDASGQCDGVPAPGNCHERGLCESQDPVVIDELTDGNPFLTCEPGQSESLGAAGGGEACKTAKQDNACAISNPGGCDDNLCFVCP
jgi:hypothetical protein